MGAERGSKAMLGVWMERPELGETERPRAWGGDAVRLWAAASARSKDEQDEWEQWEEDQTGRVF